MTTSDLLRAVLDVRHTGVIRAENTVWSNTLGKRLAVNFRVYTIAIGADHHSYSRTCDKRRAVLLIVYTALVWAFNHVIIRTVFIMVTFGKVFSASKIRT